MLVLIALEESCLLFLFIQEMGKKNSFHWHVIFALFLYLLLHPANHFYLIVDDIMYEMSDAVLYACSVV